MRSVLLLGSLKPRQFRSPLGGFVGFVAGFVEADQLLQRFNGAGMFWAKCDLIAFKCPQEQRLALGTALLLNVHRSQLVHRLEADGVVRTQLASSDLHRLAEQRLCLLRAVLREIAMK